MSKKFIGFIILLLTVFGFNISATNSPFVRYPALSPDGSKIAFCFQGDIWTGNLDGSELKRLTIHPAYDSFPKWNKDGTKIAFSSKRFGNNDIYIIPATGGIPKRLTYHSANDVLNQWHKDTILFSTARLFKQVERIYETYGVSDKGGTPERILDSLGDMPVISPDGSKIAFVRGSCRIAREAYKGSANRDIWIYDIKSKKYKKMTIYDGNDFYPRWKDNETILFISSSSGKYNIHSLQIKDTPGTAVSQLTYFKNFGVRYFDISNNGKKIAMEVGSSIYTLDWNKTKPSKLKLSISSDYRFDPIIKKTYGNKVEEYAVSPNSKLMALVIRGEVFVKENNKKKSRTVNISNHPFRDGDIVWLNNEELLFISDRDGNKDIYMVLSDDKDEKNLFKTLKRKIIKLTVTDEDESNLILSLDKKKLSYLMGNGKLVVRDIDKDGKLGEAIVLLDGWATPENVSWSPDNKWLAYSKDDLNFNREIYIQKVEKDSKPINISMHPKTDDLPVWSSDGSKLGFISERNARNYDIWFVWLKKSDWEKTKSDWEEDTDAKKKKTKTDKKDNKNEVKKEKIKVKTLQIDLDNIYERMVQVTSLDGNETAFTISKNGKTFFFTSSSPEIKGRDIFSIKWDGSKLKRITKRGLNPYGLDLEGKGKYIYMISSGGKVSRLNTKNKKVESLPFTAKMKIDFSKENIQVFNEAVKILGKKFYDPNFHGRNWNKLTNKYRDLVLKTSTAEDFNDIFNFMLGQLNASHMGLYGRGRAKTQRDITGLIGVEVSFNEKGALIKNVLLNSPADKQKSKLVVDDTIISVDGDMVNKGVNFYSLLNNKVNERVLLEVKNKDGIIRQVIIRPVSSLRTELYEQWVRDRKKLTEKYSKGKLGYLHIRGMNMVSFERFEREIMACGYGKDGIVIDVRFNGGGWTTDYLMAVLNVKQHSYTIPRGAVKDLKKEHLKFRDYYAFGERLPFGVWTKPSVALCNANSYSNAEIFSHAYKTLGIGKLIGVPTFGAVISTGGASLLNGSFVRVPFRAWYVKATDKNMEHIPAVPNFILDNSPNSKAMGRDEQLKKAVEVLLEQIENK